MSKHNPISTVDTHADPHGYLGLVKNPDGSVSRVRQIFPTTPACPDPDNPIPVLSQDIPINQANKTWARVYLPRRQQEHGSSPAAAKLPLIVCFHGGGFVQGSAAGAILHQLCCNIAETLPAVIVSVDYRLAPEHRLPAAYDDGVESLHWIKTTTHEWLTKFADFSRCFLMGCSAGGNIAYQVGLRVVGCTEDLMPVEIRGLILQQPFFGGAQRTASELLFVNDKLLPPCAGDVMWGLGLPLGVDRDHEYSNPRAGVEPRLLERMKGLGWRFLVTGCDGDPLIDRQIDFAKMLEENEVEVVGEFSEGGFHGVEVLDKAKREAFVDMIKKFALASPLI